MSPLVCAISENALTSVSSRLVVYRAATSVGCAQSGFFCFVHVVFNRRDRVYRLQLALSTFIGRQKMCNENKELKTRRRRHHSERTSGRADAEPKGERQQQAKTRGDAERARASRYRALVAALMTTTSDDDERRRRRATTTATTTAATTTAAMTAACSCERASERCTSSLSSEMVETSPSARAR